MTSRESVYFATFFGVVAVGNLLLAAALVPRWRRSSAAKPLMVLVLSISAWCSAYALSFSHVMIGTAARWLDATYVGVLIAPTALLIFVARYTRLDVWLTPRVRSVLLCVPALFAVAMFTPPLRTYFMGQGRNPQTAVLDHPGPIYWLYLLYVSVLMLVATTLVVRFVRHHQGVSAATAALLLTAMALPWIASLISSANIYVDGVDPTVLSLAVTTAVFAYLVLSERILDVGKLARREMLSAMLDGYIAVDTAGLIVDVSERAAELLELPAREMLQTPLALALAERPQALAVAMQQGGGLFQLSIGVSQERLLLVEVLPLSDANGEDVGTTYVLRDQTRVYMDELTKIGNRRYFFDQVPSLVSLCHRSDLAVSLAIIDVDGLKHINDALGHLAGDQALVQVANELKKRVRTVDVVARMGGDEFVVLLPGATESEGASIVERVRTSLSSMSIDGLPLTISAGVAEIAAADSLLHAIAAADGALYQAKEQGRNCLVQCSASERQP